MPARAPAGTPAKIIATPDLKQVSRLPVAPAGRLDVAGLLALEARCFATDRLSGRQYRRHLRSETAEVWLVRHRGLVVGSAVVFFRRQTTAARLYSLAVHPDYRGKGLARRLLRAAERRARARGARCLRLEVRQDNGAAIRLYQAHGYVCIGSRTHYYADGADAWRYQKGLQ